MKKLTKKLFISVMTLVLTAMALGTSTFAWFSMNTTATATDMQVQAKSNAMYLLIGDNANIGETKKNSNNNAITESVAAVLQDTYTEPEDLYRYPAYYGKGSEIKEGESATVGWYSASNKDSANATNQVVGVSSISNSDLSKYVLTYKVWLTLSDDSVDYNGKITCSLIKLSGSDASIAAVVEFAGGQIVSLNPTDAEFNSASDNGVAKSGQTSSAVALTSTTAVEVTIRVYIDGTSTNVYSNYINGGNAIIGTCSIQFDLQ